MGSGSLDDRIGRALCRWGDRYYPTCGSVAWRKRRPGGFIVELALWILGVAFALGFWPAILFRPCLKPYAGKPGLCAWKCKPQAARGLI